MTSLIATAPDDYLRVSYSSLNTFSSCARRFEFSKLYPRRARDGEAFAADVGKALHAGYQEFLVSRSEEKAMWELMIHYPHEAYFNQTKDDRSIYAAMSLLETMIESQPMDEYELMSIRRPDGEVVPCIEVPFEIRLEGIRLPDGRGLAFVGFMDAVMRHVRHQQVSTLDIKTHRRFGNNGVDAKYKFDAQQVPYGVVLEHIQGNPVSDFDVLYLDSFVDLATPTAELYSYNKTMDDVQEWLMSLAVDAAAMIQYMQLDFFPRKRNGCLDFAKPCYFLEMCESRDRNHIEEWLLQGEEPEHKPPVEPWILAEIDMTGSVG